MWLKDKDGVMLAINEKYVDVFLKPRGYEANDYIGNDDYSVWPHDIASQFITHDLRVLSLGETVYFKEKIPDTEGNYIEWIIIKYPRVDKSNNTTLGVAGVALPDDILNKIKTI